MSELTKCLLCSSNPRHTRPSSHYVNVKPVRHSTNLYDLELIVQIVWCLTPFLTVFKLYHGGQCAYYPCSSGVLLTSTPHNILSKPLAAFPHNHCRNNGQRWERHESCSNDYHQSSERILAKPGIEPATSCSQVRRRRNAVETVEDIMRSLWSWLTWVNSEHVQRKKKPQCGPDPIKTQ